MAAMEGEAENWLQLGLRMLFEQQRHCDVTIIAKTEEFPCHKAVLSAASGYFDTMFGSAMSESKSDRVSISEIDPNVFESVLKYIYGGSHLVAADNVESLLQAANLFQITRLKSECELFLLEELSIENCIGFWLTGTTFACAKLEQTSWTFITENFEHVRKSEELLKLEKIDFLKILRSNELNTLSEEHVCEAALEWIKFDELSRMQHFVEILLELRLCQISLDYLLDKLFSVKYAFGNVEVARLFKNAIKYHALPERRHTFDSLKVRPRNTSSAVEMTVVLGKRQTKDGENGTEFIGYNSMDEKWYSLTSILFDLDHEFATCPYGDDIYVSGGTAQPETLLQYSSKSNCWQKKSKLQNGRFRHCMVPMKNSLFVLGGCNFGAVGVVERHDISTNTWETVGELHHAVDGAAASAHGDKIFLFGGLKTFFAESDAIQCFDTITNVCTVVSKLPSAQSSIRATVFKRKTYLAFSTGEIYSFIPNSRPEFVHKVEHFDKKNFGFLKDATSCHLVGGSFNAEDEETPVDCDNTCDVIHHVTADGSDKTTSLPLQLPIPMEVCGCFNVVIRKKYPLIEYKDMLEHL